MAETLENLILSESLPTLPQLSDEHLALLNNSQQEYNLLNDSSIYPDEFNLNDKINQQKLHNYQSDQQDQFNLEQFNNLYSEDHLINFEQFFLAENSNHLESNNYSTSYQNEHVSNHRFISNQNSPLSYPNNLIELDNLDDLNEFNEFDQVNESNDFNGNQLNSLPVEFDSTNLIVDSLECMSNQLNNSIEYIHNSVHNNSNEYINNSVQNYIVPNQIINSPTDFTVVDSPLSTDCYSTQYTNSPSTSIDFSNQTLNSPTDFSVQSVSPSIDYSIQSVNSIACSYSLSNSPISNSSESSYETYFDYLNHSNQSNYSTSFTSQFNSPNPTTISSQPNQQSNDENQIVKVKRKRSKKIVSEEEIKRKLEIKLERKRRRLERKKIQNKNAAKRYREKKKTEEDEINKRLIEVKDRFRLAKEGLKNILNEKKVLIKLLKEFAEQSTDIILADWMIGPQFSNSLL